MKTRVGRLMVSMFAIAMVLGRGVSQAATFVVNTTLDAADGVPGDGLCEVTNGSGVCTLRAALQEANALAGPDVVQVPDGTYTLVSGQLEVTDDLTLTGAGAPATIIDAGGLGNGIAVDVATAHIAAITVRNGYPGIQNTGTLTLTDCALTDNDGGGISNYGTYSGSLTVENTTIRRNTAFLGGGIYSDGLLIVIGSTIADNSANYGGGVFVSGSATLVNSTVSGNSASDSVYGYGGGIGVGFCILGCVDGEIHLNNVTITNNTASKDGGGFYGFSSGEGSPSWDVANSVIAGNFDQGGDAPDCSFLVSAGYNVIGSTTGCVIVGDTTGNVTGVSPGLGPLQGNGGPTPTHAPLPGSPVIDAGNPAPPGSGRPACEAIDQRGVSRPQGMRCDVGAFELGGVPTTSTTTTSSSSTTTIPTSCAAVPRPDCEPARKASLLLKDDSADTRDTFRWSWRSSGPVAKSDFGSPTATTEYAACVYDEGGGGPTLRLSATAPAGGVCADGACWSETASGFRYADREITHDGFAAIRLKAGAPGVGRIAIKGRGPNLPLPTLPLTAPVTVQLQRHDAPACWTATFSVPTTNTSAEVKAKAD